MQEPSRDLRSNAADLADLKRAVALLEAPTLTAKVTDLIGSPMEWVVTKLPHGARDKIHDGVRAALMKAVRAALWTLEDKPSTAPSPWLHKAMAAASGAAGGFFGLPALLVELPITTTILMRTVADTARSEGFLLSEHHVQLACVEVFGLGGSKAEGAETGYYAARAGMAEVVALTAKELAQLAKGGGVAGGRGMTAEFAKLFARAIDAVAARFGVVITEKMAAQAAPVIGAAFGAAINALFADFYQDMARGHFIMKRLEGRYGPAHVEAVYRELAGIRVR